MLLFKNINLYTVQEVQIFHLFLMQVKNLRLLSEHLFLLKLDIVFLYFLKLMETLLYFLDLINQQIFFHFDYLNLLLEYYY
jgi:hypothetical protein